MKSNSPNDQEENESEKVSRTSSSKSASGEASPLSVTSPTGLNLSPGKNAYPGLSILKFLTSNKVDPMPVVEAEPTSRVRSRPVPVSVVAPIPRRDTPTTSRFSYDGAGILTIGFVYPDPPLLTVKIRVPPAPTTAETSAPVPGDPPNSVIPIETDAPRYPDP